MSLEDLIDFDEPEKPKPTTLKRRGGTVRELSGFYGPGKQVPAPEPEKREPFSLPVLEGAANTITAQGFDYVPASLAYLYSKANAKDGDKKYSFSELLDASRERTSQVAGENPIGYGAGQLGGLIYSGGRALPAAARGVTPAIAATLPKVVGGPMGATAGKMAPWIAAPAVMGAEGAIQGAAQSNGDLSQTMRGAGIGAGFGLAGKTIEPMAKILEEKFVTHATANILAKIETKKRPLTPDETQAAYAEAISALGVAKDASKRMAKELLSAAGPAAIGGTVGAAGAAAAGQDPMLGAKYGAGGAVIATKLKVLDDIQKTGSLLAGRFFARPGAISVSSSLPAAAGTQGVVGLDNRNIIRFEPEKPPESQSLEDLIDFD